MKSNSGQFVKGQKQSAEMIKKAKNARAKSLLSNNNPYFHGMYDSKIYTVFRSMITRCNGTAGKGSIKKYKEKGITVCDKWKKFNGFYEDMGATYKDGLTIDRIDNSKGYYKENCRWSTQKSQQNNRTNNIRIDYLGMNKTLSEWSDYFEIPFSAVRNRYYRYYTKGNMTIEALFAKLKAVEKTEKITITIE